MNNGRINIMKIGFITDTNVLKKQEGELNRQESFLNNLDVFIEYINDLSESNIDKKMVYIMPNIILEELYYQKKVVFDKRFSNMLEVFEELRYGIDGKEPKNIIEEALNKEINKYKKSLEIIQLECTKELFEELVDDALNKRPPFDKTTEGKKEDAGFKEPSCL